MKEKIEELLKRIKELEEENKKFKKKKRKNKRKPIKTPIKDIIDYWEIREYEGDLSVDWAEADKICWRCGCEKKLQRCHIIPDSLGGKDEPSNLVLLCERCHIDAPNVESRTFMWDWIRANETPFYNTFWNLRAQKEYEFIYHKTYIDELAKRDIISPRDMEIFFSLPIGRSANHFAHPWKNDSTNAGILRMRLEAYDKKYPNKKPRSSTFRKKEEKFDNLVGDICCIAKKYNWNIWEGRTANPFSLTISTFIEQNKQQIISIKLCRDGNYRACYTIEVNPNNLKSNEYIIFIGSKIQDVINFLEKEIKKFEKKNGRAKKQEYVFTINPIYRLKNTDI